MICEACKAGDHLLPTPVVVETSRRALDLTDPMIREMAENNHRPDERWTLNGDLQGVYCRTCGQSWPCATRKALNAGPTCDCCKIGV